MPNLVYLNSKYIKFIDAKIPIEDRGFQFSDSVYEVVKIINKKINLISLQKGYKELLKKDISINIKEIDVNKKDFESDENTFESILRTIFKASF